MKLVNENLFSGDNDWVLEETDDVKERIIRIKSLSIDNFRGIRQLNNLNVDADIILLTGPNGFGKTSFIEALCLLLTGHYYRGSDTLLFLKNGEPVGSSIINAQMLVSHGNGKQEERPINLTIPKNYPKNPIQITGFTWPVDIKPEIVARASFFYQDLLGCLFDEEDAKVTLREFIAPVPRELDEVQKQIKNALKRLEEEEKKLFSFPGIPGEDEISRQRRETAAIFTDAWTKLSSITNLMQIPLPKRSADWLLLISGKNLRHGWEGELRNLANECLALLPTPGLEPLPENAEPEESLRRIDLLLRDIERNIASRFQDRYQIRMLLASLPEAGSILEQEMLAEEEKKLEELQKEIKVLQEKEKSLNMLVQYYRNPDGPGLAEILAAFRRYGENWASTPLVNNEFAPPKCVIEWLRTILKTFYYEEEGLDEIFAAWQTRIQEEITRLRQFIAGREQEYQLKHEIIAASKRIWELTAKSVEVANIIAKARQSSQGKLSKETLLSFLSDTPEGVTTSPPSPGQVIASVHQAIQHWLQVEDLNKKREERLKGTEGYNTAVKLFEAVRTALQAESSKRESLMEKVLELPEKEVERLADLVNQVFSRFRTVKGLYPVSFERGQKNSGSGRNRVATWNIVTNDRRPLGALSTGQKAQLALALLLSLNIALDKLIPHNIIGLDDTTTALDMAQLPREATLLRQIAYGAGECDFNPAFPRRQIFIVSHHEDLTHRLIDFLIPPEGRKMHILNFSEWEPESGPKIDSYSVDPALAASKEAREYFGRLLKQLLIE
ncbi:DNA replication and repair protein RecF [Neomoorella glycerini]|uniref:DNA replication and repair protein RecF n=1 Tax=Neomoorella glycerini TaxID=55779 RepID=A0A6I5ZTF1_9FIRM|nr:ATP-binding protein [Moorella glycerini]QGP92661.1 DNA replication and repair protein RecF [Moorella glycerini]